MQYLFTLGRTSSLCFAELEAILKTSKINYKITSVTLNHVLVETKSEIDALKILRRSGGIIKASIFLYSFVGESLKTLPIGQVVRPVPTTTKKYKNFGVSLIGFRDNIQKICEEFKKEIKLHYVLPKDGHELSSAQVSNGNTLEIIILKINDEFQFFQTICVQDINYWTKKDAGRPHIDDRLGMLPLKVSRMMINLALSHLVIPPSTSVIPAQAGIQDFTILDLFCGMGSILAEAIDLSFKNVIGADISAEVLKKADENLKWFINAFSCQHVNTMMINSGAAKIADKLHDKVDLIVTEPFLGDAKKLQKINLSVNKNILNVETQHVASLHADVFVEIKNIVKGLVKMYTGCLKEWEKILQENGIVCIIVPEIEIGEKTFKLPFVEICAKTGYNIVDSYDYSREKAIVKRKIYLLKQI